MCVSLNETREGACARLCTTASLFFSPFPLLLLLLAAAISLFPPWIRSKLRAGSQKLPVLEESAWSWIILPKGIFIGRECMQKRGHRHKGAAPADLALTQVERADAHGFDAGRTLPDSPLSLSLSLSLSLGHPPCNGLPNFPLLTVTFLLPRQRRSPELPLPLSLLLACVPSVHDYESFLLIRFIEPLHQTGATFSPSFSLSLSLFLCLSAFASLSSSR